jgi:hypothetical protein
MFESEKLLVESVITNVKAICLPYSRSSNTNVLTEVDLGFGRADIVVSQLRNDRIVSPIDLNYFDAIIYRLVETQGVISFAQLHTITKAKNSKINRTIDKLIMESYVEQSDSIICFKNEYKRISTHSIAIEAKLKNWKRALQQAYRYKWFAEEAVVILDSAFVNPALKNISEFQKLGVGLAQINLKGKINFHYRATSCSPVDPKMNIVLNERIKRTLVRP